MSRSRYALLALATLSAAALALFAPAKTSFSQTAPAAAPATRPALVPAKRTAKTMIILVGDSTTAPQNGWGPGFIARLQGDIQCVNFAVNGRSTKSFINEGRWTQTIDSKPDYILIQFGHNDQKITDETRGTDPNTTFKENLTRFVTEARAIGAKPILITSVSRRRWGDDGKIHSDLFDYANPVKALGPVLKVPVIDLHQLSIDLYDKLGRAEVDTMSMNYNPDPNAKVPAGTPIHALRPVDGTHFDQKGRPSHRQTRRRRIHKSLPRTRPQFQMKSGEQTSPFGKLPASCKAAWYSSRAAAGRSFAGYGLRKPPRIGNRQLCDSHTKRALPSAP